MANSVDDGFLSVATSSLVEALGAAGATSAAAEVARARVEMSCMVAVCCWCLRAVAAVESWRRGGRVVASRWSCRGEVKFAVAAVGAREQRAARCDGPHTAVRQQQTATMQLISTP